jgi:hypothetical protein
MTSLPKELFDRLPKDIDFSEITTIVIPLCLGNPCDFDDGCHDRLDEGINGLIPYKSLIIQTGGTKLIPLCDLMFNIIKKYKGNWASRFVSMPLGWGTSAEIANAFHITRLLILNKYIDDNAHGFKIIIASNKAHLRRIRWYVKIHNITTLPVEYREAKHYFSLKDTVREWVGTPLVIIKDLIRGLRKTHEEQNFKFWSNF